MRTGVNFSELMDEISVEWIDKPELSVELRPWPQTIHFKDIEKRLESEKLSNRYEEAILKKIKPQTEVRFLGEHIGYGLFASEPIDKGSFIGEYTGIVRPLSRSRFLFKRSHYPTDYAWDFPGLSKRGKQLEIDSRRKGNETRFINHSFDPNIIDHFTLIKDIDNIDQSNKFDGEKLRGTVFFSAIRNISKGEQILIDYGEDYWIGGRRELVLL